MTQCANLETPQLLHDGNSIDVPRRELSVLVALAEAGGAPVSKEALLDKVYGAGSETDDKVVEVYVSRLRKRLAHFDVAIRVHRDGGLGLAPSFAAENGRDPRVGDIIQMRRLGPTGFEATLQGDALVLQFVEPDGTTKRVVLRRDALQPQRFVHESTVLEILP